MKRAAWIALAAGSVLAQDRTISSDAEVRAVAFGRDGKVLTGLCGDGKLRLWDVRSGAMRKALAWSKDESTAAFPQEGDVFATTGAGGIITLRDLEKWQEQRRITGPSGRTVRSVTFSADRKLVAGSNRVEGNSRDEVMRLWDGEGKERFAVPGGIGGTSAMAISPDGSVLAAGSYDTDIRIWTTRNGELLRRVQDLPVSMFAMAFTPDGRYLAAAGADRTVYFWDAKTWKLDRKLTGQEEMISAMAFSPDGRLLATGGFNDITSQHPVSILLWDVTSGKIVATKPAPHRVGSVAFSPDGKLLASTSGEKTVRLWEVR
jgi:WD40 repeat protein